MLGKKVIVIGSPGGGKSTFSRGLSRVSGLPITYLDQLNWNSDRTTVSREVFQQRLEQALEQAAWIIDGNYQRTLEVRIQQCDTVFFLDFPVEVCLEGVRSRFGKSRPDIPWVETQVDWEFMQYIRECPDKNKPKILALREKYPFKRWVVFHSRGQADAYLQGYEQAKCF